MSAARQYELVYILAPESTEQEVADLHAQIESIVQRYSGTLDRSEPWGRRKLAYEIGPHKEGIYVLEVFTGGPEIVKELDRRLKVLDRVVRHLVVRVDEDQAVAARRKAARHAESTRRRAARGLPPLPDPSEQVAQTTTESEAPPAPAEA
jgi:small subunit ribosomal protein S6